MGQPVKKRDGTIMSRIVGKLGQLQRKEVLAYFEFVALTGNTDPMCERDVLPPAFAAFYRSSNRRTDPIDDFLSETKYVEVKEGGKMLMSEFKELYNRYRVDNDMGKSIRWSEDVYRTAFSERGIIVTKEDTRIDGTDYKDVDVAIGVVPHETAMND